MTQITLIDNEYVTLWCDPETSLIRYQYHQFTTGEPFRELHNATADAIAKYKCSKVISDDTRLGIAHPKDVAWTTETLFPRAIKAGWKYWAIVLPTKITGKRSMNRIASACADKGLCVETFTSMQDALRWIESKN